MTSSTQVNPVNRELASRASNALRPIFPLLKELKQPESAKMLYGEYDVVQSIDNFIQELYEFSNSETKRDVIIPPIIKRHSLSSFVVGVQTGATYGEMIANSVLHEICESIHLLADAFSQDCMSLDDRRSIVDQLEHKCSETYRTYGRDATNGFK
jgi:hypothetical protein